jgi:hypothetical protein
MANKTDERYEATAKVSRAAQAKFDAKAADAAKAKASK